MLEREPDIAIVVSDMQMPEIDGAAFLARVKEEFPDAVRLLLTGHADMAAAARAVNEGRIFRFLTKPCSPPDLRIALAAALQMHELLTAERVLLQKTLVGSVKAVVNVLGLTNPEALGRAMRIKDKTRRAAQKLDADSRWGVEFAAMFSQIAAASLPEDTVRKLYRGAQLSSAETEQLISAIEAISAILAELPRLEPVTRILSDLTSSRAGPKEPSSSKRVSSSPHGCCTRSSTWTHSNLPANRCGRPSRPCGNASRLRRRHARRVDGADSGNAGDRRRACRPLDLKVGMVLAEDLKTTDGLLLLPRGFELTRSSCVHIVERFAHCLPERVRVHVAPDASNRSSTPAAG